MLLIAWAETIVMAGPRFQQMLTTPGAALERLAQAPGRPREIIGYARSAEGIRGRAGPRVG